LPVSLHPFLNELKQSYTIDEIFLNAKPNFRHENALSHLKLNGYLLGLGSNSIREIVDIAMKKTALYHYFDIILSNQDIVSPKPSPEMYEKIISEFNLRADECLIIEDNDHGIIAARESGAHVLIVQNVNDVTLENIMNEIQEIENA